jgi:hypothetical protein
MPSIGGKGLFNRSINVELFNARKVWSVSNLPLKIQAPGLLFWDQQVVAIHHISSGNDSGFFGSKAGVSMKGTSARRWNILAAVIVISQERAIAGFTFKLESIRTNPSIELGGCPNGTRSLAKAGSSVEMAASSL